MKTVTEVAPAEEKSSSMIEAGEFALGPDRIEGEDRMIVACAVEDALRINDRSAVERDEVVTLFGDSLEGIHPVVRGGLSMGMEALFDPEIPRGPRKPSLRHDGGIGMEVGLVALVVKW